MMIHLRPTIVNRQDDLFDRRRRADDADSKMDETHAMTAVNSAYDLGMSGGETSQERESAPAREESGSFCIILGFSSDLIHDD